MSPPGLGDRLQSSGVHAGPGAREKSLPMSACPTCQADNPAVARFCGACGNALTPTAAAPVTPAAPAASAPDESEKSLAGEISKVITAMVIIEVMTWRHGSELGMRAIVAEFGDEFGAGSRGLVTGLLIGFNAALWALEYIVMRYAGVRARRPGWVTGLAVALTVLTLSGYWWSDFAKYNWIDWLNQAVWWAFLVWMFTFPSRIRALPPR